MVDIPISGFGFWSRTALMRSAMLESTLTHLFLTNALSQTLQKVEHFVHYLQTFITNNS